ncbi:MAG: DUF975 family protein [Oscillospiraceae bacterium]|nr:DUF975 family protein [Oscillospiraceae bacterium]
MRLRRLIKRNAVLALRRNWSKAAAISLIILVIWSLFVSAEQVMFAVFDIPPFIDMATSNIYLDDLPNTALPSMAVTLVLGFIFLLVMTPISLGAARWFYNLTDGRSMPVYELFDSFSSFGKFSRALWLMIFVYIQKAFWTVVFLAAPAAMITMGELWRREASRDIETLLSVGLEVLGVALLLLMGWFLLVWLMRYSLVKYTAAADEDITVWKAIKQSIRLTRGRRGELLLLEITLIGWRILDLLILPRLFTAPYISTIYALYARFLIESDKMEREKAAAAKAAREAEKDRKQEKAAEEAVCEQTEEINEAQSEAEVSQVAENAAEQQTEQ